MISFIIPAYNASKTIEKCIDSITPLKQVADIEVIVVNDGSSDDTLEKLKKNAEQYEFIKVIDQNNQGVSAARNCGIKNAKNKYVYFVDADDCISTPFFEKWLRQVKTEKIDLYVLNYTSIMGKSEVDNVLSVERVKDAETLAGCFLSIPLLGKLADSKEYIGAKVYQYIIRRDILVENDICFPIGIHYSEDLCFLVNLMKYVNTIKYINETGYFYYVFQNSLSHSANANFYNDIMKVYQYITDMQFVFVDRRKLKLGFVNLSLQYYSNHYKYKSYKKNTIKLFEEIENVDGEMYSSELNCFTFLYYISLKHRCVIGTYLYNKYLKKCKMALLEG